MKNKNNENILIALIDECLEIERNKASMNESKGLATETLAYKGIKGHRQERYQQESR